MDDLRGDVLKVCMRIEVGWVTLDGPIEKCSTGAPWCTSVKEPWCGLGDAPVSTKCMGDSIILATFHPNYPHKNINY